MHQGPIEYVLPTTRSFDGMKRVLFQPFDMGKWFVLGFTAWLAGLLDGGGSSGGGGGGSNPSGGGGGDPSGAFFQEVGQWLQDNMALAIGIGLTVLLILVAIGAVLLWVSSRGKFMFLDNVVHNRAQVQIPWSQFRALGNSLFRWRLVFAIIVTGVVLLIAGGTALAVFAVRDEAGAAVIPLVVGGIVLVISLLPVGYISLLLEHFVIPLMYRDSLKANDAWRRFLALHGTAMGKFVLFFLWNILLSLGVGLAIILLGIGTCCIGFIIMAIPYLGAVLLLPVSVFFRFLGPEFLRQFGSDYDILLTGTDQPPAPA